MKINEIELLYAIMRKLLPFCTPTEILEYLDSHPSHETGERKYLLPDNISNPRVYDYYLEIENKIEKSKKHLYFTELLKVFQLLTNEGLISPINIGSPFETRYQLNQFDPISSYYGQYDFLILGFHEVRNRLKNIVRPIILDKNADSRDEDIGTGFIFKNIEETQE